MNAAAANANSICKNADRFPKATSISDGYNRRQETKLDEASFHDSRQPYLYTYPSLAFRLSAGFPTTWRSNTLFSSSTRQQSDHATRSLTEAEVGSEEELWPCARSSPGRLPRSKCGHQISRTLPQVHVAKKTVDEVIDARVNVVGAFSLLIT